MDYKYCMYLDSNERLIIVHSLNELRNKLLEESRDTFDVDEVLLAVVNAPYKRVSARKLGEEMALHEER